MNADGSDQIQLTSNSADDTDPAWSPDSKNIIIASNRDYCDDIYMIDSDGYSEVYLTDDGSSSCNDDPSWSPNGDFIAYSHSNRIYVMKSDGSSQNWLKNSLTDFQWEPVWSPNGTQIAFTYEEGGLQIYIMNADGSATMRVTSSGRNSSPDWRP